MLEKKVRNKFIDFIWDYYITNRQISRENDEYNREHPNEGWSTSAKVYVGIILLGVLGIIIRYCII